MVKALRKIELMHRQFGVIEGKTCRECSNLTEHRYDKLYRKCKIYGETSSEATDWAMRWKACGICPFCGKPLTDEAVQMVMERLEEQQDDFA